MLDILIYYSPKVKSLWNKNKFIIIFLSGNDKKDY